MATMGFTWLYKDAMPFRLNAQIPSKPGIGEMGAGRAVRRKFVICLDTSSSHRSRKSRSPNARETASCIRGVLRFRVWEKYLYAGRAGDVGATGDHATALTVGGSTRLSVEMDYSSFFVTLGIGIASEDGVS